MNNENPIRTFIFHKGEESEAVKAKDINGAWEALEAKVGDTEGWELQAAQG